MSSPDPYPPIYIEEITGEPPAIIAASTHVTAFVGDLGHDRPGEIMEVSSFREFTSKAAAVSEDSVLAISMKLFFDNGGRTALIASSLEALADGTFNIVCMPVGENEPPVSLDTHQVAAKLCAQKRALYLIDPPAAWFASGDPVEVALRESPTLLRGDTNSALYFPRLKVSLPNHINQMTVPPSGAVAGVMARTDVTRAVWKAPAGVDASIRGVVGPDVGLTDRQNDPLNRLGVNCLRVQAGAGLVVWGARTRAGVDDDGSDWKYVPVRRLALFIESSLEVSLGWVVFEPNGERLWQRITLTISNFLHGLFRQGAFQASSPRDAFFVFCDANTTTAADIENGVVNIQIGFAPLKQAEFIVLNIQVRASLP